MKIYRVAIVDGVPGLAAKRYDGRWHIIGDQIVYFAPTSSAALLEWIAHAEIDAETLRAARYSFWVYDVPDDLECGEINTNELAAGWEQNWLRCQKLTRMWHTDPSAPPALWVPSAVDPFVRNLIVRPDRLTAKIKLIERREFQPDARLVLPERRRAGAPEG